jgi:hypothetical protein
MDEHVDGGAAVRAGHDASRFTHLPKRIPAEDMVETTDTHVARDPEGGRDTDRDFMIRYAGG